MRLLAALALALSVAACAQTPAKPKPEPPAITRVGTVGHIAEVKTRGMTASNWLGSIKEIYFNEDTGRSVAETVWEVTVFYEDHTKGNVTLPERPDLRIGQRVRVTGNKIEPAGR
jgi:nitrous oxide reductase accessory protein NosL